MPFDDEKKTPAEARYLGGGDVEDNAPPDSNRSVRRQYLSKRLHAAGRDQSWKHYSPSTGGNHSMMCWRTSLEFRAASIPSSAPAPLPGYSPLLQGLVHDIRREED